MKLSHVLVAIVIGAPLAACSRAPAEEDSGATQWKVEGTRLLPGASQAIAGVRLGSVDAAHAGYAQVSGRLLWTDETTARVFTPFNGRIERILANPGDKVARGQPLLSLTSSDYGQAQAEARKADADLRMAQRQFERARDLLDAGVLARKDFEQSEADLRHAEAEASRTSARLRSLGERRDEVDGTFTLRTPFAGTIVERSVNAGTEVRADAAAPLFVITDPHRMTVQLDIPEVLSRAVQPGQDVEFSISSMPGQKAHARITHVADEVDPATQTVRVRGVVENQDLALRGESFIEAMVPLPLSAEAPVRVPADALILVGDQHYLFEQQGAGYERVPVRIASLAGGDSVEVVGNVHPGEHIVIDGALYLEQVLESGGSA
jgi:cobalt-zinc-cadmium efflux system membrane fusion protein